MPDYFYVYPQYLAGPSRALGRRVNKEVSVGGDITTDQLLGAAKTLGFEAVAEDKHYPRSFWKYDGRIKVTKKPGIAKAKCLRMLAAELSRNRQDK